MKPLILTTFAALFLLAGCGNNNEAQEDYARCNDEFASDLECTEEEFRDFLIMEAEYDAEIYGGLDKATVETQSKVTNEISDKVAEIFE